jgi:hypothetical protein
MFNALYTLLALFLVFTESMHVCNLDPATHVFYAFEFAFKSGCDTGLQQQFILRSYDPRT